MAELRLARLPRAQVALLRVAAAQAPGSGVVLVGGAVRDAVLGRPAVDVDLAVSAGALGLARRCAEQLGGTCVVLDAERGAVRVVADRRTLDIADFRAPTLEADLAARDFTVNALAVRLAPLVARGHAPIIDPTSFK